MPPRRPRFKNFAVLPPATIALLLLAAVNFYKNASLELRAKGLGSTSSRLHASQNLNSSKEMSSAILLDSIVSLVQNYYVDSERVEGQKLVSGTMRSIAYALPDLKYNESPGEYSLESKSERIEFKNNLNMDYDEVLGHLKSLIGFCDRISLPNKLNSGDNIMLGSERNSTSIVLNALLSSLDAHSSLLSSESYQELRQGTEGTFGGLGVLVGVRDNLLTVLKPLPNSPASRKDIREDDKIISINGFNTFGVPLDKLIDHMRGDPGTSARLVMLRSGAWSPQTIDVKREVIEVNSVEAFEHHKGNIHVLRLVVESFASRTASEISSHIKKFKRKYPLSGLALDLRGNPGGLLDQAIQVSDLFLESGIVVTTRGRQEEIGRASETGSEVDFPMVVLMNEDSASASEIVAGALQDNNRAVVIGQPSFGKGSVQTVFELPEQRALKLTIARYFTPLERSIQNVGIIPDVWLQPVYKNDENVNLFGRYRYHQEQFLPNRLNTALTRFGAENHSNLKGYALLGEESLGRSRSVKSHDQDMILAMTLFEKSVQSYGQSLPMGARRSSHWLALAHSNIQMFLNDASHSAISWLEKSHRISWKPKTDVSGNSKMLAIQSLRIEILDHQLKGVPGEKIMVPWKLTNLGSTAQENVSVFVQSQVGGFETSEIIVGRINGKQELKGNLALVIPNDAVEGKHYINAGIALDAQAIIGVSSNFLVEVGVKENHSLIAKCEFIDGNNSLVKNVLEPGESGKIKVLVTNQSQINIKNVEINLRNLAGQQLLLNGGSMKIDSIAARDKKELVFQVQANSKIESEQISVGVTLNNSQIAEPFFTVVDVQTTVVTNASKDALRLSH